MHGDLVRRGVEQRVGCDRHVRAGRELLAVKRNGDLLDAGDAGDGEHPLIDARIADGAAERPALTVLAAPQRMEVVDKSALIASATAARSASSATTTSPRTTMC